MRIISTPKRGFVLFGLICLIAALCFILAGCGNNEEKQRQEECVQQIAKGLEARWEIMDQEPSSFTEKGENTLKGVRAEIDAISNISVNSFEDNEFKELFSLYKDSLQNQLKGIEGYPNNVNLYNSQYIDNGQTIRVKCLNSFIEQYGLKVAENDEDTLEEVVEQQPAYLSSPNEKLLATSEYGDTEIKIQRFVIDEKLTQNARGYDIQNDQSYGVLECVITNKNYSDPYNGKFVSLGNFMAAGDASNVIIPPLSSAYDYAGYKAAAGAFCEIPKGQTLKVAVPYAIDNDMKEIGFAIAPNHIIVLPIEHS